MKTYTIKTTGSGTKEEIINALNALVKSLETCDDALNGKESYEDETLFTELNEE